MTEQPPPTPFALLRSFSHEPRGPWSADGEVADLAEELHMASRVSAAFPSQSLGPSGTQFIADPALAFALGRKALSSVGPAVSLPEPPPLPVDLRTVTLARRSGLPRRARPVDLTDLATLLALSVGASPHRPGLRVTPSGGALYPIDTVVLAHDVTGLATGCYLYDVAGHSLLRRGNVSPETIFTDAVGAVGATPSAVPVPPVTLAFVATFARSRVKYGLRGYRFALLEAGHIAQAFVTIATALDLASQPWGGFVDDVVDSALELDGLDRSCVYLLSVAGNAKAG